MRLLRLLGAQVDSYVPHRQREGYSLNDGAVDALLGRGFRVAITVDNGASAHGPAARAMDLGLDLIITDHHEVPAEGCPAAVAVINPKRPDCGYPFKGICGVGLAFKLAWALAQSLGTGRRASPEVRDYLLAAMAYVAIGTVADVATLVDENRVLVHFGLKALAATRDPGLRALLEVARVAGPPTARDLGFRVGPRLNAAGRLGEPSRAVELLITVSPARALELARELDQENRRRRDLESVVHREARVQARAQLDPARLHGIVVAAEGWHPGVVGIVASRIAEEFYRPTLLVALEGCVGKGSARSIPPVHLYEALDRCRARFERLGGHSHAAGFTIQRDRVEALRADLDRVLSETHGSAAPVSELAADAELDLSQVVRPLVRDLGRLAPFGEGNPEPLFVLRDVAVAGEPRRMGGEGAHLAFHVRSATSSLRAVAFGRGAEAEALRGARLDLAVRPVIHAFRGAEEVELEVRDLRIHG